LMTLGEANYLDAYMRGRPNNKKILGKCWHAGTSRHWIWINWESHCCRAQWLITLIHEMLHIKHDSKNANCRRPSFQREVLAIMLKMNWGLL
jgi:hypothetical protein